MGAFMVRTLCVFFGLVFFAIGILGFIPQFMSDGKLLGVLHVNAAYNVLFLIAGSLAIWASSKRRGAKLYFQIAGILFLIFALFGFYHWNMPSLWIIANSPINSSIHLLFAILLLYLGFFTKPPARE